MKATHFFYCKQQLTQAIDLNEQCTFIRYKEMPLAETTSSKTTKLLITDQKHSTLQAFHPAPSKLSYTPYGAMSGSTATALSLGFNGEIINVLPGGYLLGQGYRAYSPSLMRFYAHDNYSPFGQGGLNSYAYTAGDPINFSDPSGHVRASFTSGFNPTAPTLKSLKKIHSLTIAHRQAKESYQQARQDLQRANKLSNDSFDTLLMAENLSRGGNLSSVPLSDIRRTHSNIDALRESRATTVRETFNNMQNIQSERRHLQEVVPGAYSADAALAARISINPFNRPDKPSLTPTLFTEENARIRMPRTT
ncbi:MULTISPECIES: RHS repeat-associated core domain-containing protein [unclassified Pseudomonas]|uniref:RHS repeat-associated core domain-containing protein n=1 Tax=unclassified Pseudomonas TaxID=196821 RepID=UPI0035C04083